MCEEDGSFFFDGNIETALTSIREEDGMIMEVKYGVTINGIKVDATYAEEDVRGIFIPLLKYLSGLRVKKGGRVLALLAAPPGAGKSTLLSFLRHLSEGGGEGIVPVTTIGMDGFHRYQEYLLSHTLTRDGREYKMVEVKGCPETFDLERLLERVERIARGENLGWPDYDRMTHNPREDAIRVDGDVVIMEGNYLLLDRPGWRDLRQYADLAIGLRADADLLRSRLIERKVKSGNGREAAEAFVDFSDMYNVNTCLRESAGADLELKLTKDGGYEVLRGHELLMTQ